MLVVESRKSFFHGEFVMKIVAFMLFLLLGVVLPISAVAQADSSKTPAAPTTATADKGKAKPSAKADKPKKSREKPVAKPNQMKSMKKFQKQQRKNEKKVSRAQAKAQKNMMKRQAGR
jgi:outer membrane biosynthesis protein TonB